MSSPNTSKTAEKILASLKGLRNHLQTEEEPLFAIPAIWDSEQQQRSMPCDVVLTNQRLLAYVFVTFPREHLFLEAFTLSTIITVSLRHKTFEPLFRELLVSDSQRKIYIRATPKKIESLYEALRSAIEHYASIARPAFEDEHISPTDNHKSPSSPPSDHSDQSRPHRVYGRQDIRTSFDRSPLAITLLFTGGLLLEIAGAVVWAITHSLQTGLPLFIAGIVAVSTAFIVKRRQT